MDSGGSFKADTYALGESGPAGYTAGSWSCDRPARQPVRSPPAAITVGVGDDVTCTINNNDNAPSLHLRKTVTNDNGGTALEPRGR